MMMSKTAFVLTHFLPLIPTFIMSVQTWLFIQASSSFAAAVFWNLLKTGNHWKHFSHQCTMGKFTSGGRPWKWAFLATDSNIYYECANFRLFIQASSSFAAAVFWNLLKTGNHWKHFSHQCTMGKFTSGGWPQKWAFSAII